MKTDHSVKRTTTEIKAERASVVEKLRGLDGAVGMDWPEGVSGNPLGRPRGRFTGQILMKAIQEVEKENNIDVLKHFVLKALSSDVVLLGLMRKLIPDLKAIFVMQAEESLSSPEIEQKVTDLFKSVIEKRIGGAKHVESKITV